MDKKNQRILLFIFLLGIFIGAMDTGIVSPARTVIASEFNIASNVSVWMITIYTLAYAVVMPISGKLSDKYGKKKVYSISIAIFGIGSLLCGISAFVDSFEFLLVARVIQAIGGGGIMPIATAYIGESFPPEKRGTALGMVGATYGIATTLGPTIGSALLKAFGNDNWGVLFFVNVPICIVVLLLSTKLKESKKDVDLKSLDIKGSIIMSVMILSLMYALTNLNFHAFSDSLKSTNVYPFLIVFLVLLPLFIYIENKVSDPIINLNYFKDRNIAITLVLSFIVGCGLMGIVFVPQFGENVLKIETGSGGYLVTLMAIFSGLAAPIGGKLIDKYSAKLILILGFTSTIIGTSLLAFWVADSNSTVGLFIGLCIMGLGMGFTMGTPINYLMQSYVPANETASAQSTVSLVRSIGVAISPNILVNFIAKAGESMPSKLMEVMPPIPGSAGGMGSFTGGLPQETLTALQSADVTNIVDTMKNFSSTMLDGVKPQIQASMSGHLPPHTTFETIFTGIKTNYLASIDAVKDQIQDTFQSVMNSGFASLFIGACIIAVAGLIFTFLLKKSPKKENTQEA